MFLEWREREHEDMNRDSLSDSLHDAPTVHALRQCGLLNFFFTSPMWANVHLLEYFISHWDHDLRAFDLQAEILEIALEDIYFITRLSHMRMPVKLEGTVKGGDPMSVQDYVYTYYMLGSQKKGPCIPIVHIYNFPL